MLGILVALTARRLKAGDKFRLTGLQVRKRAVYMGEGTPRPTRRRGPWSRDWSNTIFNGSRSR